MKLPSRVLCAATLALAIGNADGQAHQPPKVDADTYVWEYTVNPYSGDAEAIAEGQRLYRSTCYICHGDTGARGPNLRKSKLKGQAFMKIVVHGRRGTQMPAWKGKLTESEMWKVYSFIDVPLTQ